MSIRKLYDNLGENYDAVLKRFGSDETVKRFALKFVADPSFSVLSDGLEKGDVAAAFRGAHTLKGVAATLGFGALGNVAARLTETLRGGEITAESEPLYLDTQKEYDRVIAALKEFGEND